MQLYVGNLAAGLVTEAALRQVFDSALMAAFPQAAVPGQQPVVNVNIHSDGRYGFIEFRSPDYATAALQLNGQVMLMGQTLNIGRPASYVDPSKVSGRRGLLGGSTACWRVQESDIATIKTCWRV
jgi:splicing factor U2AF subunit